MIVIGSRDVYNTSSLQPLCLGIVGQDCQVTHVVASGDTCEAIAEASGTTFDIILANNPNVDSDCSNIHPGEVCASDAWAEIMLT